MKKHISLILMFIIALALNAQEFKFDTKTINYGKIAQGSDGKRTYNFTNIGDVPIIIKRVNTTCSCLVAKGPEKPIMPGKKGEIEVVYDTKRLGGFSKGVIVYSNVKEEVTILKIKGIVVKSENIITR